MISYQYQFLGGALAALHTSRRPPYLNKTTTQPHQMRQQPMKRNRQTFALPAAIAASFLFGCSTEKITDRTDPSRPSAVQAQEGYDTFGRKWGNQPPALSRNDFVLLNYTGTITDIDYSD